MELFDCMINILQHVPECYYHNCELVCRLWGQVITKIISIRTYKKLIYTENIRTIVNFVHTRIKPMDSFSQGAELMYYCCANVRPIIIRGILSTTKTINMSLCDWSCVTINVKSDILYELVKYGPG